MGNLSSRPRFRNAGAAPLPLFDWADRQARFYRPLAVRPLPIARRCRERWGISQQLATAFLAANGINAEGWDD